ncbi:hypothetical protein BH23VER1_BH23VER1_12060 [soil metagenome]
MPDEPNRITHQNTMTTQLQEASIRSRTITTLNPTEFASLARRKDIGGESGAEVVSMCLPTEVRGAETRENHIRFKNVWREALERYSGSEAAANLRALEFLNVEGAPFWQHQSEGLILSVDAEGVEAFHLPFKVGPFVYGGSRVYTLPAARLLAHNGNRVLALDLDALRLFRFTGVSLVEENLPEGVPASLEEAMQFDDPERSLQHHTAAKFGGSHTTMFHGQGTAGDEATKKPKIRRFFEMVRAGLPQIKDRSLVLLGPPDEVGIYRNVADEGELDPRFIELNPGGISAAELTARVREWFAPRAAAVVAEARERVGNAIGQNQGSDDAADVILHCVEGRVSLLVVREGSRRWGRVDAEHRKVELHDGQPGGEADDDELVDLAVHHAASTGARVIVDTAAAEGAPDLAAAYRY